MSTKMLYRATNTYGGNFAGSFGCFLEERMRRIALSSAAGLVGALILAGCGGSGNHAPATPFLVTKLVSDQAGQAPLIDANLVNPWGLAINPTGGAFWVADNGKDVATLY